VQVQSLQALYESLKKEVIAKVLASRPTRIGHGVRINETEPAEAEGMDPGRVNGVWELHILKHLIKCCNGILESEGGGAASESVSEFEDSDIGPDNDEPATHPNKGNRTRMKKRNQRHGEASLRGWAH
jgi:hypothetical protein